MIIGPREFRQFQAEVKEAHRLNDSMTIEESVARLKAEKPELVEHYLAHVESTPDGGTFQNPYMFRVLWKWRQIAIDTENRDENVQQLIDRFSEILRVPAVKKTVGIRNNEQAGPRRRD